MKLSLITQLNFLLLLLSHLAVNGQAPTQTIRGTIIDQDTKSPLIGASVIVVDSDPIQGGITDAEGAFRIEKVPVGRVSLKVTYIGYEDKVLGNLLLGAGKELILNIDLVESLQNLEAVVVSAKKEKSEVLNEMAVISARSFSVDETSRYAGAISDPARMVSSFAGVTGNAEGDNDIVVRGNSPRGVLWRMEGIEIPNPNHYASEGSTGGPINALASNMLDDSDFYTGAFAPEYGNALSGVFDIRLKKGNEEKREYTARLSTLGMELTLEGPFKQGYNGSYLANYRYSSLALMDAAGILDFDGVPKYQDLSYKVHLPLGKNQYMTLFGLGALSKIDQSTKDSEEEDAFRGSFGTSTGVAGLSHTTLINDKAYWKNIVSFSHTGVNGYEDVPDSLGRFYKAYDSQINKGFLRVASTFNYKFDARHKMETGAILTHESFDLNEKSWNDERDRLETFLENSGYADRYQLFTSWKYRINNEWTMVSGVHYTQFALNNTYSIEPRWALKWQFHPRQSFSLGSGVHSKLESMATYLVRQQQEDGSVTQPNRDLAPTKAAHFVVGYDHLIGPHTYMKIEAYYQHLYDVPVEDADTSTFSLINMWEDYTDRTLVNEGTGRNYGLELTLERYLHNGLFFMTTASLYQSYYTAMDGVERKSAYNGNYAANFLIGKEFQTRKPGKIYFVNAKVALLGGNRFTPIDLEASRANGYTIRDESRPFSVKGDDVLIPNLAVGVRKNKKNTTREFKIDIQNVSNQQAVISEYYVSNTGKIVKSTQLSFLPTISYAISF